MLHHRLIENGYSKRLKVKNNYHKATSANVTNNINSNLIQ